MICGEPRGGAVALAGSDPKCTCAGTAAAAGPPAVGFMFPGVGTQYANMAAELYRGDPPFRRQIDACLEMIRPHCGFDLGAVLHSTSAGASDAIDRASAANPALFIVEYLPCRAVDLPRRSPGSAHRTQPW